MKRKPKMAYHRNGVSGCPFVVSLFKKEGRTMVGVQFLPDGEPSTTYTAVFDVELLAEGNIKFGENSWRGDDYGAELAPWTRKYLAGDEPSQEASEAAGKFAEEFAEWRKTGQVKQ